MNLRNSPLAMNETIRMSAINKIFMRAAFSFAAVLALMLPYTATHAISLSEAQLDSWLNEPLNARIQVFFVNEDDLEKLNVSLKPVSDASESFLTNIHQELVVQDGNVYIHVRSVNPIKRTYVRFLLEISFQGNFLARKYAILLNPRL
ncbi:MAG: type IV pilus assembly protein FimV [Candidatus Eutrophobiaceae bacterium]